MKGGFPPEGRTDIAALSAAVVAAAIAMFTIEGPWHPLGVGLAITLILVVFGYVWGHSRTRLQSWAVAAALGVIFIPLIAFPVELIKAHDKQALLLEGRPNNCQNDKKEWIECEPRRSKVENYWTVGTWIAVGLLVYFVDRRQQARYPQVISSLTLPGGIVLGLPHPLDVAKTTEEAEQKIKEHGFLTIDSSPLLRDDGRVWVVPYFEFRTVSVLLNDIWATIGKYGGNLPFGSAWVIRNKTTGEILTERNIGLRWAQSHGGQLADLRSLEDVNILPNTTLEIIPGSLSRRGSRDNKTIRSST
jgi:hypothetical protein